MDAILSIKRVAPNEKRERLSSAPVVKVQFVLLLVDHDAAGSTTRRQRSALGLVDIV